MRKTVKDKLYYMAEEAGIPKSWWPHILDVSETSLRKWSYNPLNVSEEMRDRIQSRIFTWAWHRISIRFIEDDEYIPKEAKQFLLNRGHEVMVHAEGECIMSCRNVKGFLRDWLQCHDSHAGQMEVVKKYNRRWLNSQLCRITEDSNLEMPVGVYKWDETLTNGYSKRIDEGLA